MTSPTRVYSTYFDSAYAAKGLTMIETLRGTGELGQVYVLALDSAVPELLTDSGLPGITVVTTGQLEDFFPGLADARIGRSAIEYVFTLTPWITRFAQEHSQAEWTVYLDADLGFFAPVEGVFDEMAPGSVAIVPHRFPPAQKWRLKYGTYNVAWVAFRNDEEGRRCLRWWADSCRDWCHDEVDEGRFADQGYLDDFERLTDRVVVIRDPGVNLAPWNLQSHVLADSPTGVRVDGRPLVFFHFHGLERHGSRYYMKHLPYDVQTTSLIRELIYRPYCRLLDEWHLRMGQGWSADPLRRQHSRARFLGSARSSALRLSSRLRGETIAVTAKGHRG